jgi:uncharacterized membrane protein
MKPIHIIAGLLALMAGAVALYALKGSRLHRKSGLVFVGAIMAMSSSGALMAILKPDRGTALGGVLTFYMVGTALLTVRRSVDESRRLLTSLMLAAATVSACEFVLGFAALNSVDGRMDGYPAQLFFVFGIVALLSVLGDARTLWVRNLTSAKRLARHIWRMCFAMWIATASFFLGQPKVFPEPLRHLVGVRAIPVLLVLVVMFYWLARVLFKGQAAIRQPMRMPEALQ